MAGFRAHNRARLSSPETGLCAACAAAGARRPLDAPADSPGTGARPPSVSNVTIVVLFGDSTTILSKAKGPTKVAGEVVEMLHKNSWFADTTSLRFVDKSVGDETLAGIEKQMLKHRATEPWTAGDGRGSQRVRPRVSYAAEHDRPRVLVGERAQHAQQSHFECFRMRGLYTWRSPCREATPRVQEGNIRGRPPCRPIPLDPPSSTPASRTSVFRFTRWGVPQRMADD